MVDTAIIHGIYDISKEGDPARSHAAAPTARSPCPIAASRGKQSCMLETVLSWSQRTGTGSHVCCIFVVFSWAEYLNCLKCSFLTVPWELEWKLPWPVWRITSENIFQKCWAQSLAPRKLYKYWLDEWKSEELWSQRMLWTELCPLQIHALKS